MGYSKNDPLFWRAAYTGACMAIICSFIALLFIAPGFFIHIITIQGFILGVLIEMSNERR